MNADERRDLLDRYVRVAMVSESDARLLWDFAESGATCASIVDAALNAAGWGSDANRRRRALAVVLANVRSKKVLL